MGTTRSMISSSMPWDSQLDDKPLPAGFELADGALLDEAKHQLESVAVARDRVPAGATLLDQTSHEEVL